jgi:hypothetical protein
MDKSQQTIAPIESIFVSNLKNLVLTIGLLFSVAQPTYADLSPLLPNIAIKPNIVSPGQTVLISSSVTNPTNAIMPNVIMAYGGALCAKPSYGLPLVGQVGSQLKISFSDPNSIATGTCYNLSIRMSCIIQNLSPNETATVNFKIKPTTLVRGANAALGTCGWDVYSPTNPHYPVAYSTLTIR